ncbi:Stf0 family sulfotransferase [Mesorhizobium sp. ORM6]
MNDSAMFDAYITCGTPRTGSTLLCKLLASTRTAGDPHSFYRRQDISEWAEDWKLPGRDTMGELEFNVAYLNAAIAAGARPQYNFERIKGSLANLKPMTRPGTFGSRRKA